MGVDLAELDLVGATDAIAVVVERPGVVVVDEVVVAVLGMRSDMELAGLDGTGMPKPGERILVQFEVVMADLEVGDDADAIEAIEVERVVA